MNTGLEGKYVLVRGTEAGVHVGVLQSLEGSTAILTEGRRLYIWKAAEKSAHLNGVANHGLSAESNVGEPVERMVVVEDVCELLLCSTEAENNLRGLSVSRGEVRMNSYGHGYGYGYGDGSGSRVLVPATVTATAPVPATTKRLGRIAPQPHSHPL